MVKEAVGKEAEKGRKALDEALSWVLWFLFTNDRLTLCIVYCAPTEATLLPSDAKLLNRAGMYTFRGYDFIRRKKHCKSVARACCIIR